MKPHKKGDGMEAQDAPRYLHRNPGMGRSDYTDRAGMAMRRPEGGPELEAVDEETQREQTKRARTNFSVIRAEEIAKQEDRSMTAKLKEVRIRARKDGVDISREMADAHRAIEMARRKLKEAA
jgi:hypothetical protein